MLPGSALGGVICSFSPTGDQFAIAAPDGRVRVFDTGSGRLLVSLGGPSDAAKANGGALANGHLVESHTCLAWVGSKEKSKKKQAGGVRGVAVGTAAGDVKLFDVQLGELKWRSTDAVHGGVKSLVWSAGQGVILATGKDCKIASISVEDGAVKQRFEASKYPISCIALAPDAKHVFGGGSSMQLWDLAAQERAAKYTGHPTEVRAVSFVPGQPHAVSAASGERHVAVWEVPPAKKSKKQHPALTTLSLEDPAVALDAACLSEGETFSVAALSEAGEAYVWLCHREAAGGDAGGKAGAEADGRAGLACQLVMRVRVGDGVNKGSDAGKEEAVLGIRFQQGTQGPSLLVARGSTAKPAFDTLAVPAEAPAAADDVIVSLRPVGGVLLPSSAPGGQALDKSIAPRPRPAPTSGPTVNVLGTDNIGQPVLTRAAAEAAAAAGGSGRKRGADGDDPEAAQAWQGAAQAAGAEDEVPDLPVGEVPLGERVAAVESRALGGGGAAAGEEAGPSGGGALPMPAGSAKADSLSVLLTQAIRSNDRILLERCLATSNATVIANTVARIVPMDAALFLKAAVDRLVSKPNRAVQLVPWIRAVLHTHTAYLMSAPGVQPALTSLFQAIDARCRLQDPLLRLYGRLGLVLHHARDRGQGQPGEQQRPGPEVVFEDDLEEPAAEDAFAPAALSEDEEAGDDDEGSEDESEENEFDAMLADGPGGRGGGDDDDLDSEDLDDLLDDD